MPVTHSDAIVNVANGSLTPSAYTLAPPAGAYACEIQAYGGDIYLSIDGNAPSATNGIVIKDGTSKLFSDAVKTPGQPGCMSTIKLLQATATATAKIYYYKQV